MKEEKLITSSGCGWFALWFGCSLVAVIVNSSSGSTWMNPTRKKSSADAKKKSDQRWRWRMHPPSCQLRNLKERMGAEERRGEEEGGGRDGSVTNGKIYLRGFFSDERLTRSQRSRCVSHQPREEEGGEFRARRRAEACSHFTDLTLLLHVWVRKWQLSPSVMLVFWRMEGGRGGGGGGRGEGGGGGGGVFKWSCDGFQWGWGGGGGGGVGGGRLQN